MLLVARVGDEHACPKCRKCQIISGGSATIDGRPVARIGDKTTCGAVITSGSSLSTDDGKPVAYLGCQTSVGGVIVSGSPNHKVAP